jgi:hypothetical protein
MIWWRPTYPLPSHQCWWAKRPFRMWGELGSALVDRFFLVKRFPEPFNDRDSLRW